MADKKNNKDFALPVWVMAELIEIVINLMLYGLKLVFLIPAFIYWGSSWEKKIKGYFKWVNL